jgi:hypothetical protein
VPHNWQDEVVYPEWITATSRGVSWDEAKQLLADVEKQRKERAAHIAGILLGKNIRAAYELQDGEAIAVCHFCCDLCRSQWSIRMAPLHALSLSYSFVKRSDLLDGEVCEECGKAL